MCPKNLEKKIYLVKKRIAEKFMKILITLIKQQLRKISMLFFSVENMYRKKYTKNFLSCCLIFETRVIETPQ